MLMYIHTYVSMCKFIHVCLSVVFVDRRREEWGEGAREGGNHKDREEHELRERERQRKVEGESECQIDREVHTYAHTHNAHTVILLGASRC